MTKWHCLVVSVAALASISPCVHAATEGTSYSTYHHSTPDYDSYEQGSQKPPKPVYLSPGGSDVQQGPVYLADMINQLKTEKTQIMGPTPVPEYDAPPLPVSHSQLKELYNNAVKQASSMGFQPPKNAIDGVNSNDANNSSPGYYYYYFPITDSPEESNTESSTDMIDMMNMLGNGDNAPQTKVEPLFVAMASFIGLSTLFAFSVLFLPKFGSRKRSEASGNSLNPLTNVVMEALDSGPERRTGEASDDTATDINDVLDDEQTGCPARLACEIARALRRLHLHRGPLRALERILPSNMGKHVQRVRESAHRRDKCSTIRCQPE